MHVDSYKDNSMQQVATDTFLRHKLNQLYEQFVNKQNCDILLRVEDKLIQAHSCIIASGSTKLDQIVTHHQNKLVEKGFCLADVFLQFKSITLQVSDKDSCILI